MNKKAMLKKLQDLGTKVASDDVPVEVKSSFAALEEQIASSKVPFWKALAFKDDKFSKTALFASIGNIAVLVMYVGQSLLAGTSLDIASLHWVVPAFDPASAAMVLGILNGTYLGNNVVKKGAKE